MYKAYPARKKLSEKPKKSRTSKAANLPGEKVESHYYALACKSYIRWRVTGNKLHSIALPNRKDWKLLTPFGIDRLYGGEILKDHQTRAANSHVFYENDFLFFTWRGKLFDEPENPSEIMISCAQKLLRRLRYITGQFEISEHVYRPSCTMAEHRDILCRGNICQLYSRGKGDFGHYQINSAIDDKSLKLAFETLNDEVAISNQIMNDAIASFKTEDFQKAILFSAMTI